MVDSPPPGPSGRPSTQAPVQESRSSVVIESHQEFLVQPVDASWLQCNIECQEACPVGTNCRGYLNLAAEGRFEEGYILSREPNPVAAMCAYVCSAPCERACRRGDIDRPLAIRAMKRFLVEWHAQSGIPDEMPLITPRDTTVAVVGAGPAGLAVARELAVAGHQVTVYDELPMAGGTMLVGVPAFRLPRHAIEMDFKLVERLGVTFHFDTRIGRDITFEQLHGALRRGGHLRRRHERGAPRHPGQRPGGHPVRRRLHASRQPRRAAGGRHGRRHRGRRLHGHGLLAHEPAPRCRATSPSPTAAPAASSSWTRRSSARRSARASSWTSSSARWRSSVTRRAAWPACASCATGWASRTPRGGAARCPSRARSTSCRPRRSSRPSARPRTTPSCPWRPASRSAAAACASTRAPTPPTCAASSPAATS